jgi:hypothetical protein
MGLRYTDSCQINSVPRNSTNAEARIETKRQTRLRRNIDTVHYLIFLMSLRHKPADYRTDRAHCLNIAHDLIASHPSNATP